jgi:ribosome-associated protein
LRPGAPVVYEVRVMEQLSRTEKKKSALSLQELGERLVKLSNEQLRSIELPESLLSAIQLAKKTTKHGALQRQMQYIGTLMRKHDTAAIREFLHTIEEGNHKRTMAFRRIETWRDELVSGNDQMLETVLAERPEADRRRLLDLVRKAREERSRNVPSPKASRALFRYLNSISPEAALGGPDNG